MPFSFSAILNSIIFSSPVFSNFVKLWCCVSASLPLAMLTITPTFVAILFIYCSTIDSPLCSPLFVPRAIQIAIGFLSSKDFLYKYSMPSIRFELL